MKALRLLDVGYAEVQDVAVPRPAGDEVLIRVERAGVCGTDIEILVGDFPSRPPVTMGHEYAGVIAALGTEVSTLEIGQRVVSSGAWGCGRCAECRAGRWTFCANRRMLGSTADGVFAELVAVPARIVLPLPDGVDADEGQSMIAIAVCLHGIRRVPQSYARRVAVSGPGHLGLLLLQLLRRTFGGRITLFGTRGARLQLGRELGAETVNVRTDDWSGYRSSFDLVFETAGTPESFVQALELAAPGGTICVLGVTKTPAELTPSVFYDKELTVLGSRGGTGEYGEALKLLQEEEVSVKPLITHRLPLERADDAIAIARDRECIPVRVVIEA